MTVVILNPGQAVPDPQPQGKTPRTLLVVWGRGGGWGGGAGFVLNSPDAILWPKKARGPGTKKSRRATRFQRKGCGSDPWSLYFLK